MISLPPPNPEWFPGEHVLGLVERGAKLAYDTGLWIGRIEGAATVAGVLLLLVFVRSLWTGGKPK